MFEDCCVWASPLVVSMWFDKFGCVPPTAARLNAEQTVVWSLCHAEVEMVSSGRGLQCETIIP